MLPEIYCTTYCNHGHEVETGEPVDHECITIPPEALAAEIDGDFDKAARLMQPARKGSIRHD
jgi:hypothetical protein